MQQVDAFEKLIAQANMAYFSGEQVLFRTTGKLLTNVVVGLDCDRALELVEQYRQLTSDCAKQLGKGYNPALMVLMEDTIGIGAEERRGILKAGGKNVLGSGGLISVVHKFTNNLGAGYQLSQADIDAYHNS
jgi:hypothetical protein